MTDAFERDLRAYLEGSAPNDTPASLSRTIASLSDADRARLPWFDRVASVAAAAVAIVLGLVLAIIAAVSLPRAVEPGAGVGPGTVGWRTDVAALQAGSISIEVGGQTFRPPANATVVSDSGDSTYRTLEISWHEHGVPMRLNFYVHADDSSWWVAEIKTYDGFQTGEWISYRGIADSPLFVTPHGERFSGDVDLDGTGRARAGHLRIDDMRLAAFGSKPIGAEPCTPVAAAPQAVGAPEVDAASILSGYGIEVGMEAREIDAILAGHGFCRSYRLQLRVDGPRGFSQVWCVPPPGKVTDLAFGSEGDVISFVEAGPDQGVPLIPPATVGC